MNKRSDWQHFLFAPIDSWFFRESRSMDNSAANALRSIFPPTNNTLMGVLRHQIGQSFHQKNQTTWRDFKDNSALQSIIGYGHQHFGQLKAQGVWLYHAGESELYVAAPKNLLQQLDDNQTKSIQFFRLGQPLQCDLGYVALPVLDHQLQQSPIEQGYISLSELQQVLAGKPPKKIVFIDDIVSSDPRLGIARNYQTRRTEEGKLYQTQHLRLAPSWQIYMGLLGIPEDYQLSDTIVRLGGEARMAAMSIASNIPMIQAPQSLQASTDLVLYLATPLLDCRDASVTNEPTKTPVLPHTEFLRSERDGQTVWRGNILGVNVEIIAAITDKPARIGGWDVVNHCALPLKSYIPAGSCWYIRTQTPEDANKLLSQQGNYLSEGNERALGYGQVFVGIAPSNASDGSSMIV